MNTPISALLSRKGSALYSVSPSMSVFEAVAEMNRNRVGSIVVLEAGVLKGIFTERDVLRRVVGEGLDPRNVAITAVMTPGVLTVTPETTIEQAMKIFTEKRCRHLPVMADGKLCGMLSIGDVTRWVADTHRAEAEHLKNYIAGGFPT